MRRNNNYYNSTISIDVDIDDVIGKINDSRIINELIQRGFKVVDKDSIISNLETFASDKDKREILYAIFQLKEWQGKERLLEEINKIF